jgi:hypothetical protein
MLIVIAASAIVLRASATRPTSVGLHPSSGAQTPTPGGSVSETPFDVTPSATPAGGVGGGGPSETTSASPVVSATAAFELPAGWVPHANYPGITYDKANGYPLMLTLEFPPAHVVTATWKWDGSGWRLLHPANSPPNLGCMCSALSNPVYDPALRRVVVVASDGTTWAWDGTTWTDLVIIPAPAAQFGHTSHEYLSFDQARQELVLLQSTFWDGTQTWTSDGTTWTRRNPSIQPPGPPLDGGVAYDPPSSRVVVFGGLDGMGANNLSETWTWDGTTWTHLQPARRPPGGAAMLAYDEDTQEMVLFDAALAAPGSTTRTMSTWSWDGSIWSQISAGSGPIFGEMTYDAGRRELIMVGGNGTMDGGVLTWTSSGATGTWTLR